MAKFYNFRERRYLLKIVSERNENQVDFLQSERKLSFIFDCALRRIALASREQPNDTL